MRVLTPGHLYELSNFENKDKVGQTIQFIQKEPKEEGSTELLTFYYTDIFASTNKL